MGPAVVGPGCLSHGQGEDLADLGLGRAGGEGSGEVLAYAGPGPGRDREGESGSCMVGGMWTFDCDQLLSSRLSDADAQEPARVLEALADPLRLKLVNVIATSGEACAQRGKWAWFRVNTDHLPEICAVIC